MEKFVIILTIEDHGMFESSSQLVNVNGVNVFDSKEEAETIIEGAISDDIELEMSNADYPIEEKEELIETEWIKVHKYGFYIEQREVTYDYDIIKLSDKPTPQ